MGVNRICEVGDSASEEQATGVYWTGKAEKQMGTIYRSGRKR